MLAFLVRAVYVFFFFNDTATTEIYTLSLHDALPICDVVARAPKDGLTGGEVSFEKISVTGTENVMMAASLGRGRTTIRSEEHTSEIQSLAYLVCRLLLEKKKNSSH